MKLKLKKIFPALLLALVILGGWVDRTSAAIPMHPKNIPNPAAPTSGQTVTYVSTEHQTEYRKAYTASVEFDRLSVETQQELAKGNGADINLINENIKKLTELNGEISGLPQPFTTSEILREIETNSTIIHEFRAIRGHLPGSGVSPEDQVILDREAQDMRANLNRRPPQEATPDSILPGKAGNPKPVANEGKCWNGMWDGFDVGNCLKIGASWVGAILVWIFVKIVDFANYLFNQAINISVREFSEYANAPAIKTSWGVIRDLVNMGFIFVLLYIAISTILGVGANDWKKLVPKLIIVALLVNFSMFFTRVIIDISNVTANQFYLASASPNPTPAGKTPDVSTALFKNIKVFGNNPAFGLGLPTDQGNKTAEQLQAEATLDWKQIIVGTFGGVALALVASFVLLAGAVLFIIRTIRLLFLIILSPFAFFFFILPKTASYGEKWWKALANEALFAPAFLIMVYVVTKITQAISGKDDGSVIFFMLVIGLLLGALIVAKALGAAGAAGAMKFASRSNAFAVGTGMGVARLGGRLAGWGITGMDKVRFGKKDAEGNRQGSETLAFGKWAGKGISSTLKQVDKISPSVALARRNITEGIGSPLKTGGDLLSKVTKDYGISSSILGSTKDEDRELRKREKEDKEAVDKNKLDQEKRDIESLKIGNTTDEKQKAKEKVQNIGAKTIVKIDVDSLTRLATLLTDQQMTNLGKELDSDKFAKIKTAREKPFNDALGYNDKGIQTGTVDKTRIKEELGKMSHQTVAKLPEEKLKKLEVIENLIEEDIKEMRKAGVSTETIDHITEKIKTMGPSHPAYDYAAKSPARGIPIRGMGRQQIPALVGPATSPPPPPPTTP